MMLALPSRRMLMKQGFYSFLIRFSTLDMHLGSVMAVDFCMEFKTFHQVSGLGGNINQSYFIWVLVALLLFAYIQGLAIALIRVVKALPASKLNQFINIVLDCRDITMALIQYIS